MPTLEWIGKDKVVNHHLEVPYRVLEDRYTYNARTSENMIIRGDNLEALKALLPRYEGKIKCIYIDPPYNTGNEGWVYNDNVNDPRIRTWLGEVVGREGEDLSRHDKWLCMMYPRLKLLQRLLHPSEGVIFISIDENEAANLKLVCNEVFGASSFVVTIAWQKRYSRENRGSIGDSHEYILLYATDPEVFKATRNFLPLTEKQLKGYGNPDDDPRGVWQSVSLLAQGYRPNQMYEIVAPNGMIHRPPEGNCWKIIQSEYEKALADGRIFFGTDGKGVPRRKQFLSETEGLVPWSWWPFDEVGHTGEAKREMQSIFGTVTAFDTPKPTRLIERIIQIATEKDSIVLDSFAGSGTTAHAVLNRNKADGGRRKFILVEMMDYAESTTAERVRRVIDGYGQGRHAAEGTGGDFTFYDLGPALLQPDGTLNEEVGVKKIREYVYFMETKSAVEPDKADEPYYMGVHLDSAYYFYYRRGCLTTLNRDFLGQIKTRADRYTIYADQCTLSQTELERWHITFKKIPRDIPKL